MIINIAIIIITIIIISSSSCIATNQLTLYLRPQYSWQILFNCALTVTDASGPLNTPLKQMV